ncbi:UNVERIFIED_ORG: cation/acetate symporter [Paraburkholderia sediminicola]|nr:cation/acetate symporter [Paraburkholderia sediminicola]
MLVAGSMVIIWKATRRTKSESAFYSAGRSIGAWQNALALAGDFVGAGGFLALTGLIAMFGADGLVYAVGVISSWPLLLFLFAEPLRRMGKYTVADLVSTRLETEKLRALVSAIQLLIVISALTSQLVGAMAILKLLLGISAMTSIGLITAALIAFVTLGGMLATTWLEIFKAMLMIVLSLIIALLALRNFGFNPMHLLHSAVALRGASIFAPGKLFSNTTELASVMIGMALGGASMPHVLMRMNTVPDARTARRSVFLSTGLIVIFHLILLLLGLSAMVLVGADAIRAADRGGNMALPLLAKTVGGDLLLGVVSAVALSTILAVVAGLTVSGSAALSHDVWSVAIRRNRASGAERLVASRIASAAIVIVSALLAYRLQDQNVGFISAAGSATAAATMFPVLFLSVFWRGLSVAGAFAGLAVGALASIAAIYFGPLVQIGLLNHPAALFPLQNPAIVTVPLSFISAVFVSGMPAFRIALRARASR